MRKQYHLRPSPAGLQAWDCARLIALSRDLPWFRLPLAAIAELDQAYWFDEGGAKPTCRNIAEHMQLVAEADLRYPIILSQDGRVMDGMHRVVRALMQGFDGIDAVQFAADPEPDFIGVAVTDLPGVTAADLPYEN